jgi:hypothetical protein
MTLANNYAPLRQLGNGTTTQFSALWQMISATYAVVQLEDATTHALTPVTQGAGANQYQIALTNSGWTVTMGTAPTSSQFINVSRSTSLDQADSYRTSKGFQGEVEENSFDKLTAIVQENANVLSRNISVLLGDATNLVLPQASVRANQFLSFDASGNVTVSAGISNIAISAAMVPVVQAATVLAAFNLLAVNGAPSVLTSGSGTFTIPTARVGKPIRVRGVGGGGGGAGGGGSLAGTGGTTSFGTSGALGNALGGTGGVGTGSPNGGTGGVATNGTTINIQGGAGCGAFATSSSFVIGGGNGGVSPLGGAGLGGVSSSGIAAAVNSGSGGGGGNGNVSTSSGSGGGAGGYFETYIASAASSYAYAVGAAGTATSSASSGGTGGSGVIIIEYV